MLFGQGFGEIGREDIIQPRPIGQRAHHEVVQQIAVACGESPALHVNQTIRVRAPFNAAEKYRARDGADFWTQQTNSLPAKRHILKHQRGRPHAGIGIGIIAHGNEILQQVEEIAGDVHFGHGACFPAVGNAEPAKPVGKIPGRGVGIAAEPRRDVKAVCHLRDQGVEVVVPRREKRGWTTCPSWVASRVCARNTCRCNTFAKRPDR